MATGAKHTLYLKRNLYSPTLAPLAHRTVSRVGTRFSLCMNGLLTASDGTLFPDTRVAGGCVDLLRPVAPPKTIVHQGEFFASER
jgi:hypothetical protein